MRGLFQCTGTAQDALGIVIFEGGMTANIARTSSRRTDCGVHAHYRPIIGCVCNVELVFPTLSDRVQSPLHVAGYRGTPGAGGQCQQVRLNAKRPIFDVRVRFVCAMPIHDIG